MVIIVLLIASIMILLVGIIRVYGQREQALHEVKELNYALDHIRKRDPNAEDRLIHEWECRDLIERWENCFPHVTLMPHERKYSEWATFCANNTREQMIVQFTAHENEEESRRVAHEQREAMRADPETYEPPSRRVDPRMR